MGIHFNADDVFEMAEKIESNGAAFYTRAAELVTDPKVKAQLKQLAEWEGGHEKLFSNLRAALTEQARQPTTFDPNGDAMLYLRAMADRHVFTVHKDAGSLLKGGETAMQILEIAMGFERDSILFFQGLEAVVPEAYGKSKVHDLVMEEMGHVAFLQREMARLG